jgi:hypothetical protein
LHLIQLGVGQREAVNRAFPHHRQQLFVSDDDPVIALGRDREDAGAEGVAAGIFQQGRVDPHPHDVFIGLQRLFARDDPSLL